MAKNFTTGEEHATSSDRSNNTVKQPETPTSQQHQKCHLIVVDTVIRDLVG